MLVLEANQGMEVGEADQISLKIEKDILLSIVMELDSLVLDELKYI